MKLSDVKKGQHIRIETIRNNIARQQTIRLGFGEGSTVHCSHKLPSGPVILKMGMQEIAIGRKLADDILISVLGA